MVTSIFSPPLPGGVLAGEPLVLYAFLDVLIVQVEVIHVVAGGVPVVVVRDNGLERELLSLRIV